MIGRVAQYILYWAGWLWGGGKYRPMAVYYREAGYTEIMLDDVPVEWVDRPGLNWECAYDFGGKLVGVRVHDDISRKA